MTTYATWNPSDKSSYITLSNGDLTTTLNSAASYRCARASIGKSSGKWYWEIYINNGLNSIIGIGVLSASLEAYLGQTAYGWGYGESAGNKYHSGGVAYGASFTTGAVVSIALDLDNGKIWWAKNGTWQAAGNPETGANPAYTGISGTVYPMICHRYINHAATANFGASAFSYSVPSGYNSGFYEGSEQTELVDAALDLAAYYRGQSDLQTFLRAHDGVELHDLQTQLAAFNLSVDDLSTFLGAYHQHMDDASLNLITWGERQMDFKSFLAAISQQIASMPLHLWASRETMESLAFYLAATDGITLRDLGCYLAAADGVITRDLGLYLRAVSPAPLFKTITAQRISSIVSEVA